MRYMIAIAAALAAITVASFGAQAASTDKYCLRQAQTDAMTGCFPTLAACEKAKSGNTDTCIQNPAGTTGAGGMRK